MSEQSKQDLFRKIPAVDHILIDPRVKALLKRFPRTLILKAVRLTLDDLRDQIRGGHIVREDELHDEAVVLAVEKRLIEIARPSLRPVINATGVIVHTNLGRSIFGERILRLFRPLSGGYSNLEYDLKKGKRGSRYVHVEGILQELTCAEGAMVVNNNAAAVLIALETLAKGREVIVSRGQLVEIGGSFRIPDVMKKSGARMVEVGTTNKTHLRDYEEKIGPDTALLLKVHQSNFQIMGFTEQVEGAQLVELGRKYGIPVMEDLGSGCLIDFAKYGLIKEPTVTDVLKEGVDLVTFSGDKLLGGPQAGIILGKKHFVDAIRKNQLNRALRIDKLTLLALEETLSIYRDETAAIKEIPTLRMMTQSYRSLYNKADRMLALIGRVARDHFSIGLADGTSRAGGGALPLLELPSRLIELTPKSLSAHQMEAWFRSYDPPIIVRLDSDHVFFDVRTIQNREMKTVAQAIGELATSDA
jgi:L-seryl-tRNA(Ser) seleniumtransferase